MLLFQVISFCHSFPLSSKPIEWSEPVIVEQGGIDPSLFFDDDGKVYFISNGDDKDGRAFIQMSQIDIETGKKITENQAIWYGTGGRYIEAPHMYKFGDYYYLLNAEGGTEYTGKCFISHSMCEDDAKAVALLIENAFPKLDGRVEIFPIGATIGSHTGPGTVALFFWGDERTE